jgi:hypothetical protein
MEMGTDPVTLIKKIEGLRNLMQIIKSVNSSEKLFNFYLRTGLLDAASEASKGKKQRLFYIKGEYQITYTWINGRNGIVQDIELEDRKRGDTGELADKHEARFHFMTQIFNHNPGRVGEFS